MRQFNRLYLVSFPSYFFVSTETTASPLSPTLLLITGAPGSEILDLTHDNKSCTGIPELTTSSATGHTGIIDENPFRFANRILLTV